MIQLTADSRIFLAVEPTDFRRGIDALSALCRRELDEDPFSGSIFVFCNRRKTAVKLLYYDSQGFWLCMKRLSKGRFVWWPQDQASASRLSARQLQVLLWNGNPERASFQEEWRRVG